MAQITPVLDKISSLIRSIQVEYINSRSWEKMLELQGLSSYWTNYYLAELRIFQNQLCILNNGWDWKMLEQLINFVALISSGVVGNLWIWIFASFVFPIASIAYVFRKVRQVNAKDAFLKQWMLIFASFCIPGVLLASIIVHSMTNPIQTVAVFIPSLLAVPTVSTVWIFIVAMVFESMRVKH